MTNVKNVCFIFSYFPPLSMGGVECYLLNISKGLKAQGISSTILTKYYPPLPRIEFHENFILRRVGLNPFPNSTSKRYIGGFIALTNDKFFYSTLGFYEALKIVKKADAVSPQLGTVVDTMFGNKLSNRTKKPSLVIIHGRFGYEAEDIQPNTKLLQSLRQTSKVIVNRQSTRDFLVANNIANLNLMQNPIPVQDFKRPTRRVGDPRKIHVLFIGRLCSRRGPDIAVSGFIKAAKRNRDIELWIVGEGKLRQSLMKSVKEADLSDRVIFYGKQFNAKKFLWAADIFLATSPIANFPSLSLREAMAAGLPVIATDVDETKTIVIPNKTGLIVGLNSEEIGNAILTLALNKQMRHNLAESAAKYAENNFDLNLYCEKLADLLHQTVS